MKLSRWFAGKRPINLGVRDGKLAPCPGRPNCVSSYATGSAYIAPLAFSGSPEQAMARLRAVLAALPRVRLTETSATYLRAEAASAVFGFVDDLEFTLDAAASAVHLRSASRLGRDDFGVNRRRIERIRVCFESGAPRQGTSQSSNPCETA